MADCETQIPYHGNDIYEPFTTMSSMKMKHVSMYDS